MNIHHIAITVKDSEKSAKFYAENFGFKEVLRYKRPEWDGGAIVLMLGGLRLEIFQFESSTPRQDDLSNLKVMGIKHIGIGVEDARAVYKQLKAKGLDIDEPAEGVSSAWFCFLRDPDGLPIEIYQPK
ncbi:MAG TPA: VOC family protein [Candidatus Paceibacterota bacterium]